MINNLDNIIYKKWAHSPSHLFIPGSTYIVTAGTYKKESFFKNPERLTMLFTTLFEQAERFKCTLEAWAIMPNHYHFITHFEEQENMLSKMIQTIHSLTSRYINNEDKSQGRKIWFQYWDTCITNEKSYFARLHYVHMNPVKHNLVESAEDYLWCSMKWFLLNTDSSFIQTVLSFKCDKISIKDDF